MNRSLILSVCVIAIASCALEATSPQLTADGLPEGLEVSLTVNPQEVTPQSPFDVVLAVTNTTSETIVVGTAHGCLAHPGVYKGGERVPFRGSWWACTTAGASHSFPPGETVTITWGMRAELYAERPGDPEDAPAPKGTYVVRAEFDTIDRDGDKPTIETGLRVR